MRSPTLTSPIHPTAQPSERSKHLKLITFEIGPLQLALPVDAVQKVVNLTTVHGSGLNAVGITRIGEQDITVIDLHHRLLHRPGTATHQKYLILVKRKTGELMGVPVVQTPTMMTVDLQLIRQLPDSFRRADTLEIASHIAVIPTAEASITLFLLDIEALVHG